jgi:hypothetical protein
MARGAGEPIPADTTGRASYAAWPTAFLVEPSRRNRTGDPILTMEPPGTAVRTAVIAGRARPSGPELSILLRRSYAFTPSPVVGAERVFPPERHRGVGRIPDCRSVNLDARRGNPSSRQAQMKASGPGGGRGRTRHSMSQPHRSGDEPLATRPVPRAIAQHRTVGVRPAGADGGRVKVGHLSGHPQTRPSTGTHHLATNGRGDGRTPGTARIPAAPWQLATWP